MLMKNHHFLEKKNLSPFEIWTKLMIFLTFHHCIANIDFENKIYLVSVTDVCVLAAADCDELSNHERQVNEAECPPGTPIRCPVGSGSS